MPSETTIPLSPSKTYHIYGRATGNEVLFRSDENYDFFLKLYKKYIVPLAHTYCYCLMSNHYHFLVRLKDEKELRENFPKKKETIVVSQDKLKVEKHISQQFSNFLNSYAKAYNKHYKRMGGLFIRPFKRRLVEDEKYWIKLVHYIHSNPISAKLVTNLKNYRFSSYPYILQEDNTWLKTREVLEWFGGIESFTAYHET